MKPIIKKLELHGLSKTPTYQSYLAMLQRCLNPKAKGFQNYGGRGITVCQRWQESIFHFIEDMGTRPENKELGRIDNNGNYEKSNCQWQTDKENARNTRKNSLCLCRGRVVCAKEASEILGINYNSLNSLIYRTKQPMMDVSETRFYRRRKLTPEAVLDIRSRSMSQRKFAAKYNISRNLVRLVQAGAVWKQVQ